MSRSMFAALVFVSSIASSASANEPTPAFQSRIGALSSYVTQGEGNQATAKFDLETGLAAFHIEHTGQSNFTVELFDATRGESVGTLVNEIGRFRGTLATGIRRPGKYLLKFSGDGSWNVSVGQPKAANAENFTMVEGQGSDVSSFFTLEKGLTVLAFEHQGEGGFSVWILDANGRRVEHLVNVLGEYQGSQPTTIAETGTYLFNVSGEGPWVIKVQE